MTAFGGGTMVGVLTGDEDCMAKDEREGASGSRMLGVGLEMAVSVGLGMAVGWWLDGKFGWGRLATVTGSVVGLAGGMYLLIKQALEMNKDR